MALPTPHQLHRQPTLLRHPCAPAPGTCRASGYSRRIQKTCLGVPCPEPGTRSGLGTANREATSVSSSALLLRLHAHACALWWPAGAPLAPDVLPLDTPCLEPRVAVPKGETASRSWRNTA